jgi:cell division protease FtsH
LRPDNQNNGRGGGNGKRNLTAIVSVILWALVITVLINYITSIAQRANTEEILYGEFRQMVMEDKVAAVEMSNEKFVIYPKTEESETGEAGEDTQSGGASAQTDSSSQSTDSLEDLFSMTTMPPLESINGGSVKTYYCAPINDPDLISLLEEHGVTQYGAQYVEPISPIFSFLLTWVLPLVLTMAIFSFLFRGMSSKMGGGLGGVGKANAKVYVEKKTGVTFKDVAGQDEAKESLEEIIDFLHNPQKYTEIGAKLPKGALLVGSPGTGKTLLAKAVAGEANVPFFSISGSDFVEMFVGVGASRVRDLFKEASKMAPCIIFIDEIDTIGKSRDASKFGGNDEREQTLNQLLAELDGFDPTKGVIVLGATNRPEVLDKALLRPGRFDRRITVDRPNLAGRLATLQVHTRNIRLAEDVDLNKIAQATAGAVGADLANLVNEAALRAVRHGRKAVNQNDLLVSFETVIAGTEKKGTVLTEQEKKIIAYHEVGHALVAARQKNAQPVSKITIVPHTQGALGYTMQLPEEEKFLMSRDDILTEIRTLLAGRAAEEVVFNTQTSGAANDIERATDMARKLVTMYGMSEKFGMMGLATVQNQYLDGGMGLTCAQATAAQVDQEILKIIENCHQDSIRLLQDNREMLDKIASYLLEKETITGQEMMAILEGTDPALAENYGATPDTPSSPSTPPDPSQAIPLSGQSAPQEAVDPSVSPSASNDAEEPGDGGKNSGDPF